jgi:hypothetical protein
LRQVEGVIGAEEEDRLSFAAPLRRRVLEPAEHGASGRASTGASHNQSEGGPSAAGFLAKGHIELAAAVVLSPAFRLSRLVQIRLRDSENDIGDLINNRKII